MSCVPTPKFGMITLDDLSGDADSLFAQLAPLTDDEINEIVRSEREKISQYTGK